MADAAKSSSGPDKYRFRVRAADGQEVTSQVVELLPRNAGLKNPRWGDGSEPTEGSHNEDLQMTVDAIGISDGRSVRFTVERLELGQWLKLGEALGYVSGGVVSATFKAAHPAGDDTADKRKSELEPVPMRFKVELVP